MGMVEEQFATISEQDLAALNGAAWNGAGLMARRAWYSLFGRGAPFGPSVGGKYDQFLRELELKKLGY